MNPSENHGIGSYFLKQFLKYNFIENRNSLEESITLFDFERLSLADAEIRREWKYIDLGIDFDHVHIHMVIPPKYTVSEVVDIIKTDTSWALKTKFGF